MCLDRILSILKPKPSLVLPHPEESIDLTQTVDNVDVGKVLDKWIEIYQVPTKYRDYWKTKIDIRVDTGISYPAGTWEADGIRHLVIRPEWLNPGVIAHEQAHNSYALLTDSEKAIFSGIYTPLKTADPLIKLLYSKNQYGLSNDVEGHAEIYRYIGKQMPDSLKQFYPKLILL